MSNQLFLAKNVLELYNTLQQFQINIWLDGGWGVDALLGKQTRDHQDLDIVIQKKDLAKFCNFLKKRGYCELIRDDMCPWNFVLEDNFGHQVDVHVIHFDTHGNGIYGPSDIGVYYPAESFLAIGHIEGVAVKCLTAEYQVQSHRGYKLKEKDFKDVFALCSKFGILLPPEYQGRTDKY